jgi:hypothetical protein
VGPERLRQHILCKRPCRVLPATARLQATSSRTPRMPAVALLCSDPALSMPGNILLFRSTRDVSTTQEDSVRNPRTAGESATWSNGLQFTTCDHNVRAVNDLAAPHCYGSNPRVGRSAGRLHGEARSVPGAGEEGHPVLITYVDTVASTERQALQWPRGTPLRAAGSRNRPSMNLRRLARSRADGLRGPGEPGSWCAAAVPSKLAAYPPRGGEQGAAGATEPVHQMSTNAPLLLSTGQHTGKAEVRNLLRRLDKPTLVSTARIPVGGFPPSAPPLESTTCLHFRFSDREDRLPSA